jgi:hypothetical protein
MGCNPCCCSDCPEKPRSLRVSVTWPAGSGQIIPSEVVEPSYLAVTTNCVAVSQGRHIAAVRMASEGSGYTEPPTVTLSSGPESEQAILVSSVLSPVTSVTIVDGGSGYTSNPTVAFTNPGSRRRSAAATAIVRGSVTSLTMLNKGFEYTSPPTFSFSGGGSGADILATLGEGYVIRIEVIKGGNGYTSAPTVSVQGSALVATATISGGAVTAITIATPDYASDYGFGAEPLVEISGGGGGGASAVAIVGYSITAVTIKDGGDGYQPGTAVTVEGDGYGASAVAVVTGSVVELIVTDAGSYASSRLSDGTGLVPWPEVTFTGGGGSGAQAELGFSSGASVSRTLYVGKGYEHPPPTITISGGGGSGASAVADLSWEPSNTRVYSIADCTASDVFLVCTETESELFPEVPCAGCGGASIPVGEEALSRENLYGEELGWEFEAFTSLPASRRRLSGRQFVPSDIDNGVVGTDLRDHDFIFPGEAVNAYWKTQWDSGGAELLDGSGGFLFSYAAFEYDERAFVQRVFSRIPPPGSLKFLALETTPAGERSAAGGPIAPQSKGVMSHSLLFFGLTTPPQSQPSEMTPTFRQYADLLGKPFWRLHSIASPAFGGRNLRLPATNKLLIFPDPGVSGVAALLGGGIRCNFTANYTAPAVSSYSTPPLVFTVGPELEFTFSPTEYTGEYTISAVTIRDGGESLFADGHTASVTIRSLGIGYERTEAYISVQIADGRAATATIHYGGAYFGGGELASVSIEDEEYEGVFNNEARIFTGTSGNETTSQYTQPTVTAEPESGDQKAALSVTLAEETDENGNPYWRVSAVAIDSAGAGHPEDVPILFEIEGEDGTISEEAIATGIVGSRQEPTLEISAGGNGDANFSASYAEADGEWSVQSVVVGAGGTGYSDNAEISISLGADDVEVTAAAGYITTAKSQPEITASVAGGTGAELSVALQEGFFGGWEVASVSVVAAGTGYADGATVQFSGGDQGDGGAYAEIAVNNSGEIQSVNVFFGGYFYADSGIVESVTLTSFGAYYKQPGELQSISITNGGRYYNLVITESENALPPLDCVGIVGEGNWETLHYPKEAIPGFERPEIDVGTVYDALHQANCWRFGDPSFYYRWKQTRRCPLPQLQLEIVQ